RARRLEAADEDAGAGDQLAAGRLIAAIVQLRRDVFEVRLSVLARVDPNDRHRRPPLGATASHARPCTLKPAMPYAVKEIFYTLQGEGAQTGRPSVFCRFAGCNLWSGREADRADAVCTFCDTDFVGTDGDGGGRFATPDALAAAVAARWPSHERA